MRAPDRHRILNREAMPEIAGPAFDELHDAVISVAGAIDRATLRQWECEGRLPREIFAALGEAGVFQLRTKDGRFDDSAFGVVVAEALSTVDGGLGLAVSLHAELFVPSLLRAARKRASPSVDALLEAALAGDAVGCFALTEEHGGSDISALRTSATPSADGWRVRGTKRYISNSAMATHALVVGRVSGTRGPAGLALFLVPRDEGYSVVRSFEKLGTKTCDLSELSIDAHVPDEHVIAAAGVGIAACMRLLLAERVTVCAQVLTAARVALQQAQSFMRSRHIGGSPLSEKQALRHRVATSHANVLAAEHMLNGLVRLVRSSPARAVEHAAAAKLVCTRTAQAVIDDSLQILGARGYTDESGLDRLYRDVRLARIGAGTDEVLLETISGTLDRRVPSYAVAEV